MKNYELIKDGKFYDQCYAGSLRAAREKFEPKWSGSYTIITVEICNSGGDAKNFMLAVYEDSSSSPACSAEYASAIFWYQEMP